MFRRTRRDDTAAPSPIEADAGQSRGRVLYWWTVPERPGTGASMLRFVGAWFATVLAIVVLVGLLG